MTIGENAYYRLQFPRTAVAPFECLILSNQQLKIQRKYSKFIFEKLDGINF